MLISKFPSPDHDITMGDTAIRAYAFIETGVKSTAQLVTFTVCYSKVVLVAINDEGSYSMKPVGYKALSQVAAENVASIKYRESFALIGFTGKEKPFFVKQVCQICMSFIMLTLLQ